MYAKSVLHVCINDLKVSSILFTQCRTRVFTPDHVKPIIDKSQIDKIKTDDPIHFQKILPPDGTQSPAFSYHPTVRKFLNKIMMKGNYGVAREIMDKTFYQLKVRQLQKWNAATTEIERNEIETNPLKIFLTAIDNCKPIVTMTPVSKGGITYQVPVPIRDVEREFRAMKLIINTCLNNKERTMRMYDRLATELLLAYKNEGQAVAKKVEIHKQAEANRAYAHYRWSK